MGLRCPLCGLEHEGVDRVMAAVQVMLDQVHAYEVRQSEAQVARLLRPRFHVVTNARGQRLPVKAE